MVKLRKKGKETRQASGRKKGAGGATAGGKEEGRGGGRRRWGMVAKAGVVRAKAVE